jgi:citrate lyase subunit beta/citryl-CoA lyase
MDNPKRRSWLLVPASQAERVAEGLSSGADVVVLDLVELVRKEDRADARSNARAAVQTLRAGGVEVFVQTEPESLDTDLQASVGPELGGVILSRAESAAQIDETAALLDRLERERGLPPGRLQIVAALETAPGNHAAFEIARACERVCSLTLGRVDLIMDLRPEPSGEIHLMQYLMQRLILVATAAGVTPLGAWWRAPDRGLLATPENTYQAARRGRAIGFKGAMCLRASQVEALNEAYA